MRWLGLIGVLLPGVCAAQAIATPTEALAGLLPSICAGAARGDLATRCGELRAAGAGAFAVAAEGQRLAEVPGQARLANLGDDDGAPDASAETRSLRWEAWIAVARGGIGRREGRIEAGFDADRDSLVLGATWRPARDWTADGGWQWLEDDLAFTGSAGRIRSRVDGPIVALQWAMSDRWTVDAQASRLTGHLDLQRDIRYTLTDTTAVLGLAQAGPRTQRDGHGVALRRHGAFGAWSLTASLAGDRSDTRIDALRESGGAGWALALPKRRLRSERATLDVQLGRALSRPSGVWVPTLRVGRVREFEDPQRTLTVTLVEDASSTPIRFLTQEPDRDWVEAAASLVWVRPGGHSGFVAWQQRLGHRFLDDRQFTLGWRIER